MNADINCKFCGASIPIALSKWKYGLKKGQTDWFCDLKCRGKFVRSDMFKAAHGLTWIQWIDLKRNEENRYWRERILKSRPVTNLSGMSPEKQAEMARLYPRPSQ